MEEFCKSGRIPTIKNKTSTEALKKYWCIFDQYWQTVVLISVSDKTFSNTGSYRINSKADPLLAKLAELINAEPESSVMIEGHTDQNQLSGVMKINWDLFRKACEQASVVSFNIFSCFSWENDRCKVRGELYPTHVS